MYLCSTAIVLLVKIFTYICYFILCMMIQIVFCLHFFKKMYFVTVSCVHMYY